MAVTISSGAEVDQQTHQTLGSLTLSTQYPQHISIFCAIFKKGFALKIVSKTFEGYVPKSDLPCVLLSHAVTTISAEALKLLPE